MPVGADHARRSGPLRGVHAVDRRRSRPVRAGRRGGPAADVRRRPARPHQSRRPRRALFANADREMGPHARPGRDDPRRADRRRRGVARSQRRRARPAGAAVRRLARFPHAARRAAGRSASRKVRRKITSARYIGTWPRPLVLLDRFLGRPIGPPDGDGIARHEGLVQLLAAAARRFLPVLVPARRARWKSARNWRWSRPSGPHRFACGSTTCTTSRSPPA